ncbi:PLD nuclease N-terminal domain-containing protein [Halalkalibacter sp. APA_J-10(15)]|uniref:PLD nuclease N-terminal domain-containing protein n=1 Tax=unclassified Halalkalibacter TaxID=2893063 RepID=UPI001FF23279|nr:PLD nuclease N-terminal domain-containing protein [Halalkalibacter sp. APA_J-10(15)]MCK0473061.1 PLD nuclease N-terminal domain-containing protein [Halalkalibacter sp. APA_J-10(15)]
MNTIDSDLLMLLVPIFVLQGILFIIAMISLIRQEGTNGPKWMWALLILCMNPIGAILYFILGRKNN